MKVGVLKLIMDYPEHVRTKKFRTIDIAPEPECGCGIF